MKLRTHLAFFALLTLSAALLLACDKSEPEDPNQARVREATPTTSTAATPTQPAPVRDVKLGIAIPSYVHAVAWVAEHNGAFQYQDLNADIQVMGGSAATMRGLLGDGIDIGLAGGDAAIKANLAGGDLVIVAGFVNRYYHRVIAKTDIADMAGLRGKKIGLPFLGGPQDMALKVALREAGLDYEADVEVMNLGKEFNRMAALTSGEIHATMSQTPPSRLRELGLHVVSDLPASGQPFPYAMLVVRRSTLANKADIVKRVIGGLCTGAESYKADESGSLALIVPHLGDSDTAEAQHERYLNAGPSFISIPPVPDQAGLRAVIEMLGTEEARALDLSSMIDLSLLDALRAEGHCGGT